jgi:hypothetical protein
MWGLGLMRPSEGLISQTARGLAFVSFISTALRSGIILADDEAV